VEQPYNDLDFTLIVRKKRIVPHHALHRISRRYEEEIHIEVDLSRPLTVDDIKRWPRWLMWRDLLHGHIVVRGKTDILTANAPKRLFLPVPLIEATRLLLNRGAGLLWALRVVRGYDDLPDPDFVRRNYHKAALALGDALLMAFERYTTAYEGREQRLRLLMNDEPSVCDTEVETLYDTALTFKFRPDHVADCDPTESQIDRLFRLWERIWLVVETRRTGRPWSAMDAYTAWDGLREPDQHRPACWPRNVIHNRRLGRWSLIYPREDLYRALPRIVASSQSADASWEAVSKDFLERWKRFN
jgi:hypothetical protein